MMSINSSYNFSLQDISINTAVLLNTHDADTLRDDVVVI